MTDERSTNVLDVRRRWLDGNATDEEMAAARDAVRRNVGAGAVGNVVGIEDAARAATLASSSAGCAAWTASTKAAAKVAGRVLPTTEDTAAGDVADAKVKAAQAAWLRENCKPSFEIVTKEAER